VFPKPVKDSNKNLNYLIYTYNSKSQLLSKKLNEFTPKIEYKNLTKDTFKDITKKQKQNFLTLELFFHPKIFFEIEKMLLISSDSQILKDLNKNSSISDVYDWYAR
jgi:lipopolysaccharide biosynthesis glycosyltransferase